MDAEKRTRMVVSIDNRTSSSLAKIFGNEYYLPDKVVLAIKWVEKVLMWKKIAYPLLRNVLMSWFHCPCSQN